MADRKILIISIFITFGAIAFLSGYLLMPEYDLNWQTGTFLERFNNNGEIKTIKDKTPNVTPLNGRKFVSFVSLFTNSSKLIAVDNGGNIVEIDTAALTEKILVSLNKNGVSEVILSPAGNSAIYSFYESGGGKKHIYANFEKDSTAEITGELKSADFSPRGDQQVYLINKNGEGELLVAKGVNIIKKIIKTRLDNAIVSWPSEDFVSIISYDKDDYGDLFVLKENGSLAKIVSYQHDLNVRWSPSGERLVFSAKNESSFDSLFYKDIKNNGQNVALGIGTSAQKCVWVNEEEIICGVTNQAQLKDEFYKINLADKSKTLIATPNINLLVKETAISRSGEYLFILNNLDNKLYSLKL